MYTLRVAFWIGILNVFVLAQESAIVRTNSGREIESPESAYSCSAIELPTTWGFKNPPGQIEHTRIAYYALGSNSLDFYFRSLERAPIQALSVILELAGKDGLLIDRVPMIGGTEAASEEFRTPFVVERVGGQWKGPLQPEQKGLVQGVKDGIRTGFCPEHATVTFLMVQFTDGNVETYAAPNWQIGAVPEMIPEVPTNFSELPLRTPTSFEAKLSIDGQGKVASLSPANETDPVLAEWIRDWLVRSWRFHPALLNGKPVESELTVLFRVSIDPAAMLLAEDKPVLSPVTLIRLVRNWDNSGRWVVFYGHMLTH